MRNRSAYLALVLIVIATFLFRLYFAFQTPYYHEDAYYAVRQVEHISQYGTPIIEDKLSYGGRTHIGGILFYNLLAFFNLFLPNALKLIPNLLASMLIIAVFLISKELTKDNISSLFASFISGFTPLFLIKTFNNVTVYTMTLPLAFFTLFCLLRINRGQRYVVYFVVLAALLSLTHPSSFLLVIGLLLYLLFVKAEHLQSSKSELEPILFVTFLIILIQFFLYRSAFLAHGPNLIWQNIPKAVLNRYFADFNILRAIFNLGVMPFIFGLYILYISVFKEKNKSVYILIGFVLSILLLLWLKLVNIDIGLMYLGVLLALLFALFFYRFQLWFEKTRIVEYRNFIFALFVGLFLFTSVVPAFSSLSLEVRNVPSQEEIKALEWLKSNVEADAVILGTVAEGYLINSVADRRNVMDRNFMLIENIDERFQGIDAIFTTVSQTLAVELLNKYNVDYILFSDKARQRYNITQLAYIDERCFDNLYDSEEVKIYKAKCVLESELNV